MSFLWPLGLLALAAIPVIVLLHMRHTEPRVKRFPAIRFWQAAEPAPAPQTRFRKPPLTLPLLLQVLAALALGLALARPVASRAIDLFGIDLQTEPRHLLLLIDGSSSMAADAADGGTRWDAAKSEALARLGALSEGDAATILLLGSQVRTLGATDAPSLASLGERLAAMPQPGGRADLDAAFSLAGDLMSPGRDDEIVVVTDGALAVDPAIVAETGVPVELLVVPGGGANAAVVSVSSRPSASAPDLPALYSRLANFGPDPVVAQALLLADGIETGRQEVEIPANGGSVELGWALPPGTGTATVRLDHPDALPADNEATLPLARGEGSLALRILLVSDSASPLERVLTAIPGANVTVEPGDRLKRGDPLGRYDLVALENVAPTAEALARLDAPLLIVAPQPGGALSVTGVVAQPQIDRIKAGDPLLTGVDLSGVTFGEATLLGDLPARTEIIGSTEGPLALRTDLSGHEAIVLAFDLNGSNLTRRIAFPILIANVVAELAPAPPPAVVPLGETLRFEPRAGAAGVEIAPPGGEPVTLQVIPGSGTGNDLIVFGDTGAPGTYRIIERDGTGGEIGATTFVVNAGHPRESDLRPNPDLPAALAGNADAASPSPGSASATSQLWPLLAILAIGALLIEWIAALWPRRRTAALGGGD